LQTLRSPRPRKPSTPRIATDGSAIRLSRAERPNTREIIELELEVARERDEEIPVSDAGHVVIGTVTVASEQSRPQSA
jgi:hypothetical protein